MDGFEVLVLAARFGLAAAFATAGFSKLAAPTEFMIAMRRLTGLSPRPARNIARSLPWVEIVLAIDLAIGYHARWAAAAAVVLLLIFTAVIVAAGTRGRFSDCGCFGTIHRAPTAKQAAVRNGLLSAAALAVVLLPPDVQTRSASNLGTGTEAVDIVGTVFAVSILAVALVLLSQLAQTISLTRDP